MQGKKHDFTKAVIKHEIEESLYKTASEYLKKGSTDGSIVTGPNAIRHVHNFRKYFKRKSQLTICEIKKKTTAKIVKEVGWVPGVTIVRNKIEENVGRFTDADLTCRSDLISIKLALNKQKSAYPGVMKAFIFSYGCRGVKSTQESGILPTVNSVFKLIGEEAESYTWERTRVLGTFAWAHSVQFSFPLAYRGRAIIFKCFKYNAGGGPMVTCLICYK